MVRLALATGQPLEQRGGAGRDHSPDRQRAAGAERQGPVPGRYYALLCQPDRSRRSKLSRAPAGHSHCARTGEVRITDGRFAGGRSAQPRARPGAPLPRSCAIFGDDPVRVLLPLLHAQPHRGRSQRHIQALRMGCGHRLPEAHAAGARRAALRRRSADAGAQAAGRAAGPPARDSAHRDHPHRQPRAGLHAHAHRSGILRHGAEGITRSG